ncbi:thymidine phosphorylase-like [Glandiceps talaboti]
MSSDGLRVPDVIAAKRDGKELSDEEIRYFINGVVEKGWDDAQIGAMLMAIYLNDMSDRETVTLTTAMKNSGDQLTWPDNWTGIVDKHSTGGVGDKVSLPLAPALAACGMKVPMISGRGLGFTGGTLDKLESIPGYSVHVSAQRIREILEDVGCCIVGQTGNIVPADKKLYATRDVTSTVGSPPLIIGSILSKKAVENLSALILDVKCGNAAFMKTVEEGRRLATGLVTIGNAMGMKTVALLTEMDNPIGYNIGNALEVAESIQCLHGNGPEDLNNLVCRLGGNLLHAIGEVASEEEGIAKINQVLHNGSAIKKFQNMIVAQGVKEDVAERLCDRDTGPWSELREAKHKTELKCNKTGSVGSINALELATVSLELGAGRSKAGDAVDHSVGLQLKVHVGSQVCQGDVWVIVHHDTSPLSANHIDRLQSALCVCDTTPDTRQRVIDVITK